MKTIQRILMALLFAVTATGALHAQWSEVGGTNAFYNLNTSGDGDIHALAADASGNIYTGGAFSDKDGNCYVAKWNGTNWSDLGNTGFGSPLNGAEIRVIVTDAAGNVYVSGDFSDNNGNCYVAKWDGANWSVLSDSSLTENGYPAEIVSLVFDKDGNIYAAGLIKNADGYNYVAKWDKATNTWSELGGKDGLKANSNIYSLAIDADGNVYAGGIFTNGATWTSDSTYVAKWDKATNTWSMLGGAALGRYGTGYVSSIITDTAGNVYAAGAFEDVNYNFYVAKWDKATDKWGALGYIELEANDAIKSLTMDKFGNIYAGGFFYYGTNTRNTYVAKWDKTTDSWSTLGEGAVPKGPDDAAINALTADPDGNIYAAGSFANTNYNIYVAQYDNGSGLSIPTSGIVSASAAVTNGDTSINDGTNLITTIIPTGEAPVSGNIAADVIIDNTVQTYNSTPYLQRHYDIEPGSNASTSTATIVLYFTQAEFDVYNAYIISNSLSLPLFPTGPDDVNGISHIAVLQYHGTGTAPGNYTGGTIQIKPSPNGIVWNNQAKRWEITFDVTGFSGFYLSSISGALPVRLVSFTGDLQHGIADFQWETGAESGLNHFEIQKSDNRSSFFSQGEIASKGSNSHYNFSVPQSEPTAYYRLKMTGNDDNVTYGNIITLSANNNSSLMAYPDPATDHVNINVSEAGNISIYDAAGRLAKTQALQSGINTIDISKLNAGVYFGKINGKKIKFIKE